ncbi:uncharacterized protein LOC127878692 [Dreissena polymorpha]|uniref:uncharacterized protein LOC127878692 n=1 Tax=Dreissena polymorpha TaxID=45954 RepID=UPI0022652B2F|nr:uncharacterized protein LOC127878692 [Dreissena polymorpha]
MSWLYRDSAGIYQGSTWAPPATTGGIAVALPGMYSPRWSNGAVRHRVVPVPSRLFVTGAAPRVDPVLTSTVYHNNIVPGERKQSPLSPTCYFKNTYVFKGSIFLNQVAQYAVPAKKAAGKGPPQKGAKKKFEVETNAELLCTRLCGGNVFKEGEDPVLGKDEDYPDWLWKLRTEKGPIPLEELTEDDTRYWRRLRKMTMKENNKLMKIRKF